jgi:hypothetical protein
VEDHLGSVLESDIAETHFVYSIQSFSRCSGAVLMLAVSIDCRKILPPSHRRCGARRRLCSADWELELDGQAVMLDSLADCW